MLHKNTIYYFTSVLIGIVSNDIEVGCGQRNARSTAHKQESTVV